MCAHKFENLPCIYKQHVETLILQTKMNAICGRVAVISYRVVDHHCK